MQLVKKLIPKAIKEYIKKSIGVNQMLSLERLTDEIAERKLAGMIGSMHYKRFQDKVVMVTGGSGSIGKAICVRFADEGANVIVCGRNIDKLNSVVAEIKHKQGSASACILDVTCSDSIDNAFKEILKDFQKLDVLVNCAGGSARDNWSYLYKQDINVIDDILNVNLRGTILCSRLASEQMMKQNHGKIINISSTVGVGGKAGFSEYSASKAGIIGMTKSLALELGAYGITVNCITPGIVPRGNTSEKRLNEIGKTNCLQSVGISEDISYGVAFLASQEANFITGQNIIIDGGRSLGLMGD